MTGVQGVNDGISDRMGEQASSAATFPRRSYPGVVSWGS
jgi:hypothetical protein